jgi:hypothetical protein
MALKVLGYFWGCILPSCLEYYLFERASGLRVLPLLRLSWVSWDTPCALVLISFDLLNSYLTPKKGRKKNVGADFSGIEYSGCPAKPFYMKISQPQVRLA